MNKVINDSIISTISQFLKIFARFFIGIYIVKQLDIDEYGAYNLFLAIISFGSIILSFNAHVYFNIEISSNQSLAYKHKIFWSMMEMLLVFSIIFYLILDSEPVSEKIIDLLNIGSFKETYSYVLILLIMQTISMTIIRYLAFSKYVLFFQVWSFVLQTAWIIPLFYIGLNLKNIFYSQLLIMVPLIFWGLYYIYRRENDNFLFSFKNIIPDIKFISSAFKFGVGTYFALIGSFLLEVTDKTMLSILYTNEAVAYYSFSNIPFSILQGFIIGTVFLIAMPYINQFNSSNLEKKFTLYVDLSKSFILYLSGLLLIIVLLSKEIILFLGKEEYLQTSTVFPFLSLTFMLTVLALLFKHELILKKSLKTLSIIYFSALSVNVILNFVLIEHYSYGGAIFSTLIATLLIVVMLYIKTDIKDYVSIKASKVIIFFIILFIIYLLFYFISPFIKQWTKHDIVFLFIMFVLLYLPYLFFIIKFKLVPTTHIDLIKTILFTKILKKK